MAKVCSSWKASFAQMQAQNEPNIIITRSNHQFLLSPNENVPQGQSKNLLTSQRNVLQGLTYSKIF